MNRHEFVQGGERVEAKVTRLGELVHVEIAGETIQLRQVSSHQFLTTLNGHSTRIAAIRDKGTYYLDIDSILIELTEPSETGDAGSDDAEQVKDKIFAPMPGKLVKLLVGIGDIVTVRQPLLIVEAMKMENNVLSPAAGRVKAIHHVAGDQVDTIHPLIELELEHPA